MKEFNEKTKKFDFTCDICGKKRSYKTDIQRSTCLGCARYPTVTHPAPELWVRQCPICGDHIRHHTMVSVQYYESKKSPCKKCSFLRKNPGIKINNDGMAVRQCPECGADILHGNPSTAVVANRAGILCRACAIKKKNIRLLNERNLKYRASGITHVGAKNYEIVCPMCKKQKITYVSSSRALIALHTGVICKYCVKEENKKQYNNPKEIWRTITAYDRYEVSNMGRVRTKNELNLILPQKAGKYPYCYMAVSLWADAGYSQIYIHRLVMNAFCKKTKKNKQMSARHNHVIHRDGDYSNNILSNLTWRSSD